MYITHAARGGFTAKIDSNRWLSLSDNEATIFVAGNEAALRQIAEVLNEHFAQVDKVVNVAVPQGISMTVVDFVDAVTRHYNERETKEVTVEETAVA